MLTVEDIKLIPGKNGPVSVELNGNLENIPFSIHGNISNINQLIDPDKICLFMVTLEMEQNVLILEGSVKDLSKFDGINIRFNLKGESFSTINRIVGMDFPLTEMFELSGRFQDVSPKKFRISKLYLNLGKSDIKGEIWIDFSKQIPTITADFYTSYLDLREILKEKKKKKENFRQKQQDKISRKPSEHQNKVFSGKPFDLDALKKTNIEITLKGKKAISHQVALKNFQFCFSLKDGTLALDPLKATIGGGELNGRFKIDPSDNDAVISTWLKIDELDLKQMQEDMMVASLGEGKVEFCLDLASRGNSIAEVMAALNGKICLIMGEGWIEHDYSIFFDFLGTNLKESIFNIISIPGDLVKEEKNKFSEFNCCVVRFDINKGKAEATALVFDTPKMSIVGTGSVDLEKEILDIYLEPVPKEGIGGEGFGKLNLSLSELAKPFKLGGTLADPNVVVDPAQTALTLGKAIGGAVLFGPAGIAVALLTGTFDKDAANPCLGAIEAARKGVEVPDETSGILKKMEDFLKYLSPIGW
jgi:hypothetical protein